eukprot:c167_g1_i1 orf=148-321(+)
MDFYSSKENSAFFLVDLGALSLMKGGVLFFYFHDILGMVTVRTPSFHLALISSRQAL